jgi:hypothetical protein
VPYPTCKLDFWHGICVETWKLTSRLRAGKVQRLDIIVAYDVETVSENGKRRLRQIATICKDFGQRVQFSLFECRVGPA